jgi:hypothetical protein
LLCGIPPVRHERIGGASSYQGGVLPSSEALVTRGLVASLALLSPKEAASAIMDAVGAACRSYVEHLGPSIRAPVPANIASLLQELRGKPVTAQHILDRQPGLPQRQAEHMAHVLPHMIKRQERCMARRQVLSVVMGRRGNGPGSGPGLITSVLRNNSSDCDWVALATRTEPKTGRGRASEDPKLAGGCLLSLGLGSRSMQRPLLHSLAWFAQRSCAVHVHSPALAEALSSVAALDSLASIGDATLGAEIGDAHPITMATVSAMSVLSASQATVRAHVFAPAAACYADVEFSGAAASSVMDEDDDIEVVELE